MPWVDRHRQSRPEGPVESSRRFQGDHYNGVMLRSPVEMYVQSSSVSDIRGIEFWRAFSALSFLPTSRPKASACRPALGCFLRPVGPLQVKIVSKMSRLMRA
jgi:hypothetical protein